jgi:hypothetical protein
MCLSHVEPFLHEVKKPNLFQDKSLYTVENKNTKTLLHQNPLEVDKKFQQI